VGGGHTATVVTLVGFIAGSVIATFHMPFWWRAPSLGEVALGEKIGWVESTGVQLVLFAAIVLVMWLVERRYRPAWTNAVQVERNWPRFLHGSWPLMAGAVGLASLNALTLVLAGHPWTITWGFSLWGGKALQAVGYDLSKAPFWSSPFQQRALAAPVSADVVSVMDSGVVLGALLAAGLAGRFAPASRVPLRTVASALFSGLLLGYGARIAYGCNIGAYFSGIASTSLHGWLWLAAALLGTPVGLKLRTLFGLNRPRTEGSGSLEPK
jgi:hypothetical protein